MLEDLKGKKILVVTAHPDDESALAAGTLKLLADAGSEVHLICATKGEKGRAHLEKACDVEELKSMREAELQTAASLVGISHVRVYEFPDGGLSEYVENLEKLIQDHIDFYLPDVVFGFGAEGYTGHKDHSASFKAAFGASFKSGLSYYSFSLPGEPLRSKYVEKLAVKKINGDYDEVLASMEDPDFTVEVDPDFKLSVLKHHQSQWNGLDPEKVFGKDLAHNFLSKEYFSVI